MTTDARPTAPAPEARGVYRARSAPAGWRVYYAIDSRGHTIARLDVVADAVPAPAILRAQLEALLNAVDPVLPARPVLSVVPGSEQPRASRRKAPRLTLSRGEGR